MKKFLALESADTQDSEETKLDELQGEYDPEQEATDKAELANEILTFTNTVETVDTLDTIATKLECVEGGVETGVGTALTTAIEHMLARHQDTSPKIAFEEYSTRRAKLNQTTVAIEGIRDTIKRLWEKLVKMVQSILDWFKRVFNMQSLRWKALTAKNERLGTIIKEAKNNPEKANKPETGKLSNTRVARTLCEGTRVASGEAFAQSFHGHNKMMGELHKMLGDHNAEALKFANKAIEYIYKKKEVFEEALTAGLSTVVYNPVHMQRCSDQKRFVDIGSDVVVFELPLVFGNKSFFKTGLVDTGSLKASELHAVVLSSTHAVPAGSVSEELDPLPAHVFAEIHEQYKEHGNTVLKSEKARQDELRGLYQSLEAKLTSVMKRPGNEPYVGGNGKRIGNLLSMCHRLITADQISLVDYDQSVQNAALDYAIMSASY